jgi:hypothetical protein
MPVPKEFKGKKGRSGRRTKAQEFEVLKEKITQEALIELANKVVYKQLINADKTESIISAKEFALPITLKGITEKVEKKVDSKIEIINYADTTQLPAEKLPDAALTSD